MAYDTSTAAGCATDFPISTLQRESAPFGAQHRLEEQCVVPPPREERLTQGTRP